MADLHRGSLRYDLRLTGAQVTGIVIMSLVTVAIAFALGVGFGRRLAANDAPKPPEAAAVPPSAPDAGRANDFTYQHELTKVDPAPKPAPPPPPAPKPAPAAPVVAMAAPDAGAPIASGDSGPRAFAELPSSPDVPAAAVAPPPAPAPAIPMGDRYAVQFGAPAVRVDADRLAASLTKMGYGAYVVAAEVPNRGTVYRVRVGRFATKDAADALRQDAVSHHQLSGIVMHVE